MKKIIKLLLICLLFFMPLYLKAEVINLNNEYYVNDEVVITSDYKSSNESIAVIKNSKIKFLKPGEVTITSKSGDNSKKIKVYNKIDRIEIVEGDKLDVSLYKDYLLNVKVYPDNTKKVGFTWSKEDNNNIDIKTWYDGETYISNMNDTRRSIRVFEEGDYIVTVKTNDNKYSDSITIHGVRKVNEISIYPPSTNYKEEDGSVIMYLSEKETLKLSYYIFPEEVKDSKLNWASTDNNIVTVDNGNLTAHKVGTAKIVVKSNDGNAKSEIGVEVKDKQKSINGSPKYIIEKFNTMVAILWDNVEGASGYNIYRSLYEDKDYKKIATTKDTFYYDENLNYSDEYYYKVEAYNSFESKMSTSTYVKIIPETINKVEFSKVTSSSVKLFWEKVEGTGYRVYRSTSKDGEFTRIKTITTNKTTTYTDTSLKANTTYYYRVLAYKTVNGKKIFGSKNSFSVKTSPSKPKISVKFNEYDSLKITINSVKGAKKYIIERSDSKSGPFKKVKEVKSSGTHIDGNLETNLKFYYRVKACNSDNNCSSYSNIDYGTVKLSTPKITLKKKGKKVKITISNVKASEGYEIYRSTKKNGKYKLVDTTSKLKYNNKVKKGKYYYKVRAYTIIDKKKVYSNYSSKKYIKVK